ncbi:MAG: hypothetical protein GY696_34465 [Gammaproteobacteria bacterium]|nr:hypothetical protein [Gammaproteobacteria bacterium]
MALFCILIFFGTTAANLANRIVAAVKAGLTEAAGVGRRLYAYPHRLLRITLQEHKDNRLEKTDKEVKDKETGL